MQPCDVPAAGETHRLVWADLATPDDRAAAEFYTQLFGWTTRRHAIAGGEYSTLERDGVAIASMYRLPTDAVEQGVPAHWMPYVSTSDVDSSLVHVQRLGGRVLVPAQTFPGVARIAVVADPTGATFGLWEPDCERTRSGSGASPD